MDAVTERRTWRLRRRLATGLAPTPVTALMLSSGLMLGPHGLQLLSTNLLAYLEPVVSVALAALGVLIGFGLDLQRPLGLRSMRDSRVVETIGIFVLVSVGVGVTLRVLGSPAPDLPIWLAAVMVGISALSSSTVAGPDANGAPAPGVPAAVTGDLIAIVAGGLVLAFVREGGVVGTVWLFAQAIVLALAVAFAGSLLVQSATTSADEQRVFTIGAVLLLGGIAEFLALSALIAGLTAGAFWNAKNAFRSARGGEARDRIAGAVRHMQHPLVVLLLVIGGARVEMAPGVGVLAAVYVALRTTGKVVSSGRQLISPGVVAVAFALNAVQAGGDRMGPVLSVVVVGSIVSDLVSLAMRPRAVS